MKTKGSNTGAAPLICRAAQPLSLHPGAAVIMAVLIMGAEELRAALGGRIIKRVVLLSLMYLPVVPPPPPPCTSHRLSPPDASRLTVRFCSF